MECDFERYRRTLLLNVDSYLAFKGDELRDHLDKVATRYVQSVYADVRRYVDLLVREYQEELQGKR